MVLFKCSGLFPRYSWNHIAPLALFTIKTMRIAASATATHFCILQNICKPSLRYNVLVSCSPKVFLHFITLSENRTWPTETASWHNVAFFQRKVTTRRQTWHFLYTKTGDVPWLYVKCVLQDNGGLWLQDTTTELATENQKLRLTEVLTPIKARMV